MVRGYLIQEIISFLGIPNRWRSAFWFYILDPVAMKTIYERKGLNYYGLYDIGKLDQAVVRQVHLDVARTWRTHKDFRNRFLIVQNKGGKKIEILRYRKYQVSIFKILLAYSAFDSEVGYCQERMIFEVVVSRFWPQNYGLSFWMSHLQL